MCVGIYSFAKISGWMEAWKKQKNETSFSLLGSRAHLAPVTFQPLLRFWPFAHSKINTCRLFHEWRTSSLPKYWVFGVIRSDKEC